MFTLSTHIENWLANLFKDRFPQIGPSLRFRGIVMSCRHYAVLQAYPHCLHVLHLLYHIIYNNNATDIVNSF